MMMSHQHAHKHHTNRRGLTRALALTCGCFFAEVAAGFYTNSLALLADAAHMLTDLSALTLSLFALKIAARPATDEKTFGYLRAEILAAFGNGLILVLVGLGIAYESYGRLRQPPAVKSGAMLAVAAAGLLINLLAAWQLSRADMHNLNVRGAYLHVLGDILGSVGAILAGLAMVAWRWYLADPIVSGIVSALILLSSWRLLRDSVDILLEGTPRHLKIAAILADLGSVDGVQSVHDLHVWSITSGMAALSCHVVLRRGADAPAALRALIALMRERHHIEHTTIQIETAEDAAGQRPVQLLP